MHELAIADRLLDRALAAAAEAEPTRVETVYLELGTATHLVPEQVRFCLEAVAADTPAEGADVRIERTPARGECDCGWRGELPSLAETVAGAPDKRCPDCGAAVSVTAGRECRIAGIDLADSTEDADFDSDSRQTTEDR